MISGMERRRDIQFLSLNALKQILLVIIILYSPVSIILLRLLTSELLPGRELLDKILVISVNIIY